jgi:hypothetical protein
MSYAPSLKIRAAAELELRRRRQVTAAIPSPVEWASQQATIVHPSRGRIPFIPYPYQADFLGSYGNSRRIVLKARQIGFSQVFALEALYAAIHEPESTILLVSRSQDLAVNLLRYCYQTYNNLREAPSLVKSNESEMGISNGSRIKSIPANRSTGRGFAATRVYLDEFAYADYAEDIYQSVSPAVSQGGSLTIGSTPNGSGNLFHSLYLGGDGFRRSVHPWHHCPSYYTDAERSAGIPPEQCQWYLRERPKYTAQQWAAEYECDFIGSGLSLFNLADIDHAAKDAQEATPATPGRTYITSVDVGRRRDATVVNTFDVTDKPYTRVAFDRWERVPYPFIQARIAERALAYPGAVYVESNGVGDPLIENMSIPVKPFLTTARSKLQALQSLQLLFEKQDIRALWDSRERAALLGCTWDEDHTPDEVMSLAIFAAEAEKVNGMTLLNFYRQRAQARQQGG